MKRCNGPCWGLWMALVALSLQGCGRVVPRGAPPRAVGAGEAVESRTKTAEASHGSSESIRLDGFEASIREGRVLEETLNGSILSFGEARRVVASVSGQRVLVGAPLRWPAEPAARLYLEFSPHYEGPGGKWSYRCLYPDGLVAVDSQQVSRNMESLLPVPERGSVVLDLSQVFGAHGDLQAPANRCEVRVLIEGRPAVVFVLRVIPAGFGSARERSRS